MAMSGGTSVLLKSAIPEGFGSHAVKLYAYYKHTQDPATNKSTITCGMYVTTDSGWTIGPWGEVYGSYVGTKSITFDGSIPNFSGTRWLVENKTFTVTHDDEGKATATFYWKWGVNSSWGGYVNPSGSFTINLPQIARASTITSAENANLGSSTKITWTPKSKSFYYKVKLSLGKWSWTSSAICPNTTSAYTYTTSSPISYDAAKQLASNEKKGTMTATLYTYSNSACSNQVGSADTETFTVYVPEDSNTKPSVEMSLTPVNKSGVKWESLYVQNVSKVKAGFSGSGKYGADISSYKMTINNKSYSSPYTSSVITLDGNVAVTGYATDTRGFTNNVPDSITVIPYGKPRVLPARDETTVICARCNNNGELYDEGVYLRIKALRNYSKILSDGKQHNFCSLEYRWKTSNGEFDDEDWTTLIESTETDTDLVDKTITDVYFDTLNSYNVQLRAKDDVGNESAIETYYIPTSKVDFNLKEGGGGAAFGKYAEESNVVDIAKDWDLHMKGHNVSDFVIEEGTKEVQSVIWQYRKWNSGVAECWGVHTKYDVVVDKAWGALYESEGFYLTLPSDMFSETPQFQITLTGNSNQDGRASGVMCETYSHGSSTYTPSICAIRPNTATIGTLRVLVYAVGKWK